MTVVSCICETCGAAFQKRPADVMRVKHHYCSQTCFGLARRKGRTVTEKKAMKSAYDARRREALRDRIRAEKRERHRRTYDPDRARAERVAKLPRHREYMRAYNARPENKAHKRDYDLALRAAEYGDFAEAWRLLVELEREIRRIEPDKYERAKARGYYERKEGRHV